MIILTSLLSSLITTQLPVIKRWVRLKIKTLKSKFISKKQTIEEIVREEVKRQLMEILEEDKK
jgi:hypothetical protein